MFRELHSTNKQSDDSTLETHMNPRNRKPKLSVKEVPQFDGNPKNWVKWINNTETIMGQT